MCFSQVRIPPRSWGSCPTFTTFTTPSFRSTMVGGSCGCVGKRGDREKPWHFGVELHEGRRRHLGRYEQTHPKNADTPRSERDTGACTGIRRGGDTPRCVQLHPSWDCHVASRGRISDLDEEWKRQTYEKDPSCETFSWNGTQDKRDACDAHIQHTSDPNPTRKIQNQQPRRGKKDTHICVREWTMHSLK